MKSPPTDLIRMRWSKFPNTGGDTNRNSDSVKDQRSAGNEKGLERVVSGQPKKILPEQRPVGIPNVHGVDPRIYTDRLNIQ